MTNADQSLPRVAQWRIHLLRLIYLLIFLGLSSFVWRQLVFDSADWPLMTGIAKSMFAAMALFALLGVRYPLQMLPILLFETVWKAIWLTVIALPAILNGRWADVEATVYECIGIVVVLAILPWHHVWTRYITQPSEPWRSG